MNLNKEILLEEYTLFKDKAKFAFQKDRINKSLILASYCAYIAWSYPILYNFVDEDLEQLLEKLSERIIERDKSLKYSGYCSKKRVVLYCGQLIDDGALTEQYLHYFIEQGYRILVVVPTVKNITQGKKTISLMENSSGVEFYIPPGEKLSDKIIKIYSKVLQFCPEYIFLHFMPHDVVGYCVFSKINHVKRFYIVHNDHTFWLGKGCSDFFLEFRKFGYLLANQRRKIPVDKLLLLPYYPINNETKFQGFPFDRTGKVVGLSGANLYKYFMDPQLKYFHAIKELLKRNQNFVFCLCGYGDGIDKIHAIFNEKDISARFFFLGRREDFYGLVGNSDILFESFPLKGGLTQLFAIEQDIAVVGIANPRSASGSIQDNFDLSGYTEPVNFCEFLEEADSLIKFKERRQWKINLLKNQKFNKIDFNRKLTAILNQAVLEDPIFCSETLSLDDDYYLEEYLQLPNAGPLFLKSKLFLLKSSLKFIERIQCYIQLYKSARQLLRMREFSRLGFLVVWGK